ncbi:MAG: diacylglycerol kinase family enzyme [Clostridium sp.]|jgi:diacylglycerol kinase family enzyme
MKYFFIMNPGSKSGKSKKLFKKIFGILEEKKLNYQYEITEKLSDAGAMSVNANKCGYDIIVAVGGDGTINQVINGFYDENGRRISKAKMGVIYTGTSPDFCKSYGIPLKIEEGINLITSGVSVNKVRPGRITMARRYVKDLENKSIDDLLDFETRYFACCANIGLGAAVARSANSGIRGIFGDYIGTFISLIKTLLFYKPIDMMISTDGELKIIPRVHNISIGKTYYIASGIKVRNNIKTEDNMLYSLVIKKLTVLKSFDVIRSIYSGKTINNGENISLNYCETVDIYGNNLNNEIEFDGDPAGFLPCRISSAIDTLDLICEGYYE